MPTLHSDLDLGLDSADAAVDSFASYIESALNGAVESFQQAFAASIAEITGQPLDLTVDTGAVSDAVGSAVQDGASTPVAIEGDTGALEAEVAGAITTAGDTPVLIGADTGPAQAEIADLVAHTEGEAATISVDADTTEAQSAVDDLSSSTDGLTASSDAATKSVSGTTESAGLLAGGAALARGEIGGLTEGANSLGGVSAGAVGGVAALGAATFEFFKEGVQATGATQRFNTLVGDMADKVEHVKVGDLSTDLGELGIKFGSTDAEMKNATASVFQFAVNGGYSREQAALLANEVTGLGARAVAINPNLGNLDTVVEQLAVRMSRGGKFASNYGLSLTAAEISTQALADTGKTNSSELTIQEKAFAAAEIASKRYGNGLSDTVAKGAENATNQQKSLFAQLKEVIEKLGAPLAVPMFDLLKAAIPIAEGVGVPLAQLASVILPPLASILRIAAPLIPPITYGLLAFWAAAELAPAVLGGLGLGLSLIGSTAPIAGDAFLAMSADVQVGIEGIESSAGPIGWLVAGLGIAAGALGLFGGGVEQADQNLDSFRDHLVETNGALDETAAKSARAFLEEHHELDDLSRAGVNFTDVLSAVNGTSRETNVALDGVSKLASFTGVATREMTRAVAAHDPVLGALLEKLRAQGELNPGLLASIASLSDKHREATRVLAERNATQSSNNDLTKDATDATNANVTAEQRAADAKKAVADENAAMTTTFTTAAQANYAYSIGMDTAADAETRLKAAGDALNSTLDLLLGRFLTADQSTNAFHEGLLELGDTLFANGFSFDQNTKAGLANRDALDGLAQKASGAASAILQSTGSVTAAVQPLTELRASVQKLRDDMATAGQDTSFEDALLGNIDGAIAGVRAKAPDMNAAGHDVAKAGSDGAALAAIDWEAVGRLLGAQGTSGVDSTQAAWQASGGVAAGAGANAAAAVFPEWFGTGADLGTAGKDGVAGTIEQWISTGSTNAGASADAARSHTGNMHGAGNEVGAAGDAGLNDGMSGMPGTASSNVLNSVNAAGLAGANAHNVGYGIGAALSAGIGDGIIANDGYVQAQAEQVISDAESAARTKAESSSPSKLFARLGEDLSEGIAVGIEAGIPRVEDAGTAALDAAVMQAGWDALNAYLRTSAAGTEPGGDYYTGPALNPADYHDGHYDDPRLAAAAAPMPVLVMNTAPAVSGLVQGSSTSTSSSASVTVAPVVHLHFYGEAPSDSDVQRQASIASDTITADVVRAVTGAL